MRHMRNATLEQGLAFESVDKTLGVTIQVKPLQQDFRMVLFAFQHFALTEIISSWIIFYNLGS